MRCGLARGPLAGLLLASLTSPIAAQPAITSTGQGAVDFSSTSIGELSGITFLGGDQFIVVSDTNNSFAPATISIDPATGQIVSSELATAVSLAGVADLEGVAYDPRDGSILVAAEANQTITRFDPDTAALLGPIAVPAVYGNARGNFGLESLSLDPIGYGLWTANEEALTGDGPISSQTAGTTVRLQRFDAAGNPSAQYAYLTDPHTGNNNILNRAQSGVADLLALPTGDLLVLERTLGGSFLPSLRNRIYLIDPENATDTSDLATLDGQVYTAVAKTQLTQIDAGSINYEGIALGPRLDNGDYALVLVSDDGATGNPQRLLTLRISGIALPGDLTGDFAVDQQDLDLVLSAWGQQVTTGKWAAGDPSGDGNVGLDDLNTVLRGWTAEQAPAVTIPAPTGLATMMGGAVAMMTRRR